MKLADLVKRSSSANSIAKRVDGGKKGKQNNTALLCKNTISVLSILYSGLKSESIAVHLLRTERTELGRMVNLYLTFFSQAFHFPANWIWLGARNRITVVFKSIAL